MESDLGVIARDHNSPIVASGRSGFETLTSLVNPTGLGNLTASLQVQGGEGNSSIEGNITISPLNIEYCVTAPSLLPLPSNRRAPTFVQFDPFDGTTYFNDNNTVGGIITEVREPRLAIEGDIHLSKLPSAFSCLSDFHQ